MYFVCETDIFLLISMYIYLYRSRSEHISISFFINWKCAGHNGKWEINRRPATGDRRPATGDCQL
jgi:hypothetical protein